MSADKFAGKYRIPSARAVWWDYGADAAYFITICTQDKHHYFGEVINAAMDLTEIGHIAVQYWQDIPSHFPFVRLDVFVVMPNHVHGIVIIDKSKFVCANAGLQKKPSDIIHNTNKFGPQSQNVGSIIRGFKSAVKTYATTNGFVFRWQARFYDHIIRDEDEYRRIADYINDNPAKWWSDKFFTDK